MRTDLWSSHQFGSVERGHLVVKIPKVVEHVVAHGSSRIVNLRTQDKYEPSSQFKYARCRTNREDVNLVPADKSISCEVGRPGTLVARKQAQCPELCHGVLLIWPVDVARPEHVPSLRGLVLHEDEHHGSDASDLLDDAKHADGVVPTGPLADFDLVFRREKVFLSHGVRI